MTRHTQPCGGQTGYGCGQPVAASRRRLPGKVWWHPGRNCQVERDTCQAAIKRDRRHRRGGEPATGADALVAWPIR